MTGFSPRTVNRERLVGGHAALCVGQVSSTTVETPRPRLLFRLTRPVHSSTVGFGTMHV